MVNGKHFVFMIRCANKRTPYLIRVAKDPDKVLQDLRENTPDHIRRNGGIDERGIVWREEMPNKSTANDLFKDISSWSKKELEELEKVQLRYLMKDKALHRYEHSDG